MELIHAYTRAQAIADGVLVDVTMDAKQAGFRVPVALTHAVFHACVEWTDADNDRKPGTGQSTEGRLWDVLVMAYMAAKRTDGDRATFSLLVLKREGDGVSVVATELVLMIHPGDQGEPVCTIMYPDED